MVAPAPQKQEIGDGLGASEIAAAAGLDPFKSPLQLWLEHTGQCAPFAGNAVTDWGLAIEPVLLAWYRDRHIDGGEALWHPPSSLYRDTPKWARCTPDGIVCSAVDVARRHRVVQAKNVGFRMQHRWQDGPPDWVVCQVSWELFVLGLDRGDVIATLGGTPPEVYTIWRDEQMIADLLAIGEAFMKHVANRTEPRTTHHEDWAAYLAKRARSRGFIVPLDSNPPHLVDEWRAAAIGLSSAKKKADLAKNKIRRYLADSHADGVETAYGVATWRPNKNGERALRAPRGFSEEDD